MKEQIDALLELKQDLQAKLVEAKATMGAYQNQVKKLDAALKVLGYTPNKPETVVEQPVNVETPAITIETLPIDNNWIETVEPQMNATTFSNNHPISMSFETIRAAAETLRNDYHPVFDSLDLISSDDT